MFTEPMATTRPGVLGAVIVPLYAFGRRWASTGPARRPPGGVGRTDGGVYGRWGVRGAEGARAVLPDSGAQGCALRRGGGCSGPVVGPLTWAHAAVKRNREPP